MAKRGPKPMTLPEGARRDLLALRREPEWRHPFRIYLGCLIRAGWTRAAIARAAGFSYQTVQQIALDEDYAEQSLSEYRLILGLPLPLPAPTPLHSPRPRAAAGYSGRGRPRQTHCCRGHLLSGDNLYVYAKYRACRECARLRRAGEI